MYQKPPSRFYLSKKLPQIYLQYNGLAQEENIKYQYLWVLLISLLMWKFHVDHCEEKSVRRTHLLRILTSTKWAANRDVLNIANKSYAESYVRIPGRETGRQKYLTLPSYRQTYILAIIFTFFVFYSYGCYFILFLF